ncbi:MAG: potassium-transporting ATPase subunit KdpC [Hyphomicrobiaceae bacterium]
MIAHLRPAIVMLAFFTLLTGLAYPLAMTGLAQVLIPAAANGSLITRGTTVVGSALIGQSFTSDRYFQGRPSATSAPDPNDDAKTIDAPYNAANSSGSNLGPLSKKLIDRIEHDIAVLRKGGATSIPADAVTASASGLDPHISPAYAALQITRIAAARRVTEAQVRTLVEESKEWPLLGLFGEPRINVLRLNLALDANLPGSAG